MLLSRIYHPVKCSHQMTYLTEIKTHDCFGIRSCSVYGSIGFTISFSYSHKLCVLKDYYVSVKHSLSPYLSAWIHLGVLQSTIWVKWSSWLTISSTLLDSWITSLCSVSIYRRLSEACACCSAHVGNHSVDWFSRVSNLRVQKFQSEPNDVTADLQVAKNSRHK